MSSGTVTGSIGTKWLLPPLFGLPFIYHVFVEDLPALSNTAQPVTFSAGMQEMSVLCIMAALFCTGMGLKKRQPAEPGDRVVVDAPGLARHIHRADLAGKFSHGGRGKQAHRRRGKQREQHTQAQPQSQSRKHPLPPFFFSDTAALRGGA